MRLPSLSLIALLGLAGVAAAAPSPLDLQPLQGEVVLLDFWASWCVPCRDSFPWMAAVQARHAPEGLKVIAVNVDQEQADAARFLERYAAPFEIRYDPRGELAAAYRITGMPTSLLVDRHGQLRYTHVGFRKGDDQRLEAQLRQLLAEH